MDGNLSRSASIADGWLGGAVDSIVVSGCCDSISHLRDATDSGRLFGVLWIADEPWTCQGDDYLGSAIDSIGHLGDAIDSCRIFEDAIDNQRSLCCYS